MSSNEPPRAGGGPTLAAEGRYQKAKKDLEAEWDRKLECLNHPDAHDKIDAIFKAQGHITKRPKAGETF